MLKTFFLVSPAMYFSVSYLQSKDREGPDQAFKDWLAVCTWGAAFLIFILIYGPLLFRSR